MSVVRRLMAALTGVAAAAALATFMVMEGPRRADLPSGVPAVPDWVTADPEHALITVVGLAAWACLLWLCVGFLLGALAAMPGAGGRAAAGVARRILPRALRHVVELVLGVTLAAGAAAPAMASSPTTGTAAAAGTGHAVASATAWPDIDTRTARTTLAPTLAPPPPQLAPADPPSGDRDRPMTIPVSTAVRWPDLDAHATPPAGPTPADRPEPSDGTTPASSWKIRAAALGPAPTTATNLPANPATSPAQPPDSAPAPAASGARTSWPDLDPHDTSPHDPPTAPEPLGIGTSIAPPAIPPAADVLNTSEVVVLRGDTLWAIAARHLPAGATTAQIAQEWPRWWAANRQVIGPDPDRILPGHRLQPPRPGP